MSLLLLLPQELVCRWPVMPRAPSLRTEHPSGLAPGSALPAVCTGAGARSEHPGPKPYQSLHLSWQEAIRSSREGMFAGRGGRMPKGTVPGECMREDTTQEERDGGGGGGTDTPASAPSPGLGARRVAQPEAGVPRGEKGPPAPGLRQAFRRLAWGQPAECGWQRCQCARSKTRVAGGTCPGHSSSVPTSGDPPISRRARLSTEGGRPGQRRLEGSQTCVFPAQCLGQLLNLPTAT